MLMAPALVKIIFLDSMKLEMFFIKVRTFWEAHKNLSNLPHALYIYLVNVKTMRKIFSNFVCFSDSPNFIKLSFLIRYGKYLSLYDQDFKHPKYFWPQVNPNPSHQL